MKNHSGKDFGPIADDYAFFEEHATEAEQDLRAYQECLRELAPARGTVRMLDFGCGSGTVTARFLQQAGWPPARVQLTLVEPVESARRQARARLAGLTQVPLVESAALAAGSVGCFDVILANHVLYYVPDLEGQLARLLAALSASGLFVTAIAARTNALIEFWMAGFRWLGREIPYHTAEDVEVALRKLGANYRRQPVAYELTFPDTEENRRRILRFLLADYLTQLPPRPLLELFDQYHHAGRILIRTTSDHFTIRSNAREG